MYKMGNSIRLFSNCLDSEDRIKMSNGATDVLLSALVLSGSRIAKTEKEKELVVWLACRDQAFRGRGTVGFDIGDMPWSFNGFEQEKTFMLYVIIGAMQKIGWELLEFTPNEEFAQMFLDKFYELILKFEKSLIDYKYREEWMKIFNEPQYYLPSAFCKCKKHGVFLHWYGCIICNGSGDVIPLDENDIIKD